MRVKAKPFLILAAALAVILGLRFGLRFLVPDQSGHAGPEVRPHRARRLSPEAPPKQGIANAPATAPEGFYLGKGDQRVFIPYGTRDPVLRSVLQSVMDGSADPSAQGREIFLKICAACHQPDGQGKDGVAPPLAGSEWMLEPSGNRLVRIVLNGLTGPLRVRGKDWNLPMPPWRENLDDDQVAVVLTYVRSHLGTQHAGPITPESVAAARKEARATPETADDLLRIPAQ